MDSLKSATLLSQARESFAEIRPKLGETFISTTDDTIEIDQAGSGEYRVRVRLISDPVSPVLSIELFPKPNLASLEIGEPELIPEQGYSRKTRRFEAVMDGSTFSWSEKSADKPRFASENIIEIIKRWL